MLFPLAPRWLQHFSQEQKGCLKESREEKGQIEAFWGSSACRRFRRESKGV